MSNSTKDILAAHKYPPKIKSHDIFKKTKEIKKVFPEIGLPNCEKELTIDNSKEKIAAAQSLLVGIKEATVRRFTNLDKWEKKKADEEDLTDLRKEKIENCKFILKSLQTDIVKKKKNFCVINDGKLTINLPSEIKDKSGKVVFKPGERLFGVYNKLNSMLTDGKFRPLVPLEEIPQFKDFSSKNVPSNKMTVRFSSDGEEGVWDIATMSMRGISSCQTWGNGNATHVVGSMVDPFTGIIYLTTGGKFNEHGSKMIRRCVVRFVVNENTKKPYLYLERMYPSHEESTHKTFVDFLRERTDGKFEIKGHTHSLAGSYVPLSSVVRNLNANDQPYRDSGVMYKNDVNDMKAKARDGVEAKMLKIYSTITNEFRQAANSIKPDEVSKEQEQSIKAMVGSDYHYDYSYYYYENVVAMAKKHLADFDISKYENADALIKDAVEKLANSKLKAKIASAIRLTIKGNKIPSTYKNISPKIITSLSDAASEKISAALKKESEKLEKSVAKTIAIKAKAKKEEVPVYVKLLE